MNATPYLQRLFCAGLVLSMFGGCMDNTHHIDQVQNDVLLFANGMSLNVGTTDSITLSSLLDSTGLDFLMADEHGSYKISMGDTLDPVDLAEKLPVIELDMQPEPIDPLVVDFSEFNFPKFQLDPVSFSATISPIEIDPFSNLDPVEIAKSTIIQLTLPADMPAVPMEMPLPPVEVELLAADNKVNVALSGIMPVEIAELHSAIFSQTSVLNVKFDRSSLNANSGIDLTHELKRLASAFPILSCVCVCFFCFA